MFWLMVGLGIVLPLMELRIRGIHELGSPTNQAVFFYEENDDEPADWGILC